MDEKEVLKVVEAGPRGYCAFGGDIKVKDAILAPFHDGLR